MKYLILLTVLTFIIFMPAPVVGQLPILQEGIDFYEQGKYPESIRALELASRNNDFKTDAKLWSYLGLAYLKKRRDKKVTQTIGKSREA